MRRKLQTILVATVTATEIAEVHKMADSIVSPFPHRMTYRHSYVVPALIFLVQATKEITGHIYLTSISSPLKSPDKAIIDMSFIADRKSAILAESKLQMKYPPLVNLNEYLSQISSEGKCLTVLDNFQRINVPQLNTPLILRRPVPSILWAEQQSRVLIYPILAADTLELRNVSSFLSRELYCPLSKFLSDINLTRGFEYKDVCVRIKMNEYVLQVKSFPCQVHIGIFPPLYAYSPRNINFFYPRMVQITLENSPSFFVPPSIPPINCIAHLKAEDAPSGSLWINSLLLATFQLDIAVSEIRQDVFVLIKVTLSGNIQTLEALKYCPTCHSDNPGDVGAILSSEVKCCDPGEIRRTAFPLSHERLRWNLVYKSDDRNLLNLMIRHALSSKKESSFREMWFAIFRENSLTEKLAVAHSNVWQSIMKNFSIDDPDEESTSWIQSITLRDISYSRLTYIFPYYIKDELRSLRYVGCGKKGFSSIPFMELVTIFDTLIWFCIFLTMLTMSVSLKVLMKNENLIRLIFSTLKVFLEQGDPFHFDVGNISTKLRCITAIFLLIGIVLSNAYKNSNVYNMVIPRKLVLYKNFKELVRDNFSVYTRTSSIYWDSIRENRFQNLIQEVNFRGTRVYIKSNIQSIVEEYSAIAGSFQLEETMVESGILETTKFHPDSVSLFIKILENVLPTENFQRGLIYEVISEQTSAYQIQEEHMLLNSLKSCEKTALLLPGHICKKYFTLLLKKEHQANLFIGDESYSNVDSLFYLQGWIPPHVITRVKFAAESGMWKWWLEVLGGDDENLGPGKFCCCCCKYGRK